MNSFDANFERAMSASKPIHRLLKEGIGSNLWGKCSCDKWAWLGTAFGPKKRHTALITAFKKHIELIDHQESLNQ